MAQEKFRHHLRESDNFPILDEKSVIPFSLMLTVLTASALGVFRYHPEVFNENLRPEKWHTLEWLTAGMVVSTTFCAFTHFVLQKAQGFKYGVLLAWGLTTACLCSIWFFTYADKVMSLIGASFGTLIFLLLRSKTFRFIVRHPVKFSNGDFEG